MSSKEAQKAMATWVAAIADNVKNPIASISAVLDSAENHLHNAEFVIASIGQVRERLFHLNEYVSELADFAQPAVLRPASTPIERLVAKALLAAALPNSCTVRVDVPATLMARVDAAKLALVLKALLRNAYESVEATRRPRIHLAASILAHGGFAITVEDNGPGLEPEAAARALEPFYTTKEAGTGLGLAVARKYVEAHGGTIAIDRSSDLGGCRVVVSLPSAARSSEEPLP